MWEETITEKTVNSLEQNSQWQSPKIYTSIQTTPRDRDRETINRMAKKLEQTWAQFVRAEEENLVI
jgi:hypothetical protein